MPGSEPPGPEGCARPDFDPDPGSGIDPGRGPERGPVEAEGVDGDEANVGDPEAEPEPDVQPQPQPEVEPGGESEAIGPSGDGSGGHEAAEDDEDLSLKPSRKFVLAALGLIVLYLIFNFVDIWFASGRGFDGDARAAVVLGAAQYNGEPSAALRGRLDRAAGLHEAGRVGLVVVTGGGQEADVTTEAKTGYDYLRETAGIPDGNLRLEVDGSSTYQSLAATSRFLQREGIDDVILVTDPYHARRSQLIAEEVGLSARVTPTDSSVPVSRLLRETVAVSVGRVVGFRRFDAYLDI